MKRRSKPDLALAGTIALGMSIGSVTVVISEHWAGFVAVLVGVSVRVMVSQDMPSVVVGMAGGLSFYLWKVTEGDPFRCVLALLHTILGAFFGLIGAKAATGMGASDELKTVASGLGGGMGPKAIDRIERLIGRNGS